MACIALVWLGLALCWRNGFTIDDALEQRTIEANADAVAALFAGDGRAFGELERYPDRYYGVGYHALSAPLRWLAAPLWVKFKGLTPREARMMAAHAVAFATFLAAGVVFWRMLRLAGAGPEWSRWGTLWMLGNPYLLGHAVLNVKDVPFLAAWLLCTWRMLVPCLDFLREGRVRRADFLWLGAATALLLSIRLSGLLIGVQYALAFALLAALRGPAMWRRRGAIGAALLCLAASACLLAWLAYPVLWRSPWDVKQAVAFLSHHPWNGCTLTWGRCEPSADLPWTYLPSWMLAKVAVGGLAGFVLAVACIRRSGLDRPADYAMAVAAGTCVLVIVVLAAIGAGLYNELRQVLFLVPLLYFVAVLGWHRWPRVGRWVVGLSLLLAAADLARLFPYPYVWLNEAARFSRAEREFELDYWMVSSREAGEALEAMRVPEGICLFLPYPWQMSPFEDAGGGRCLQSSIGMAQDEIRPYLVYAPSTFQGQAFDRADCEKVYAVRRSLFPVPRPIELSALYLCGAEPMAQAGAEVPDLSGLAARASEPEFLRRSRALIEAGRHGEAIAVCERGLKLHPESIGLGINLAVAQLSLGEIDKGERRLAALAERAPDVALVQGNLAWAHRLRTELLEQVEAWRRQTQAGDDRTRLAAWRSLADAHSRLGEETAAVAACDAALALDPYSAGMQNAAGLALMDAGRYGDAERRFLLAARLAPGQAPYRNNAEWAQRAQSGRWP